MSDAAEYTTVADAITRARRTIDGDLADGFLIDGDVPSATVDRRVAIALEELCTTLADVDDPSAVRCFAILDGGWITVGLDADARLPEQELVALEGRDETKLRHATGISPWIARWAVRAAGGRIAVDTREDGCTVRVEAPISEPSRTAGDRFVQHTRAIPQHDD